MPGEDRARVAERCSVHGSSPAVATCDGCGRAMCLSCAIPVRGRVLGSECLSVALGSEPSPVEAAAPEPHAIARSIALAAFGLAVVATFLPWSRFGTGARAFGAWDAPPSWATLVVAASLAGALLDAVRRIARRDERAWDLAAGASAVVLIAGSILSVVNPPPFTSPWLGPWVALGAGLVAAAASATALATASRAEPAHI